MEVSVETLQSEARRVVFSVGSQPVSIKTKSKTAILLINYRFNVKLTTKLT